MDPPEEGIRVGDVLRDVDRQRRVERGGRVTGIPRLDGPDGVAGEVRVPGHRRVRIDADPAVDEGREVLLVDRRARPCSDFEE